MDGVRRSPPFAKTPGLVEALCVALAAVALEFALSRLLPPLPRGSEDALLRVFWVRLFETAAFLAYWKLRVGGPKSLGLDGASSKKALKAAVAGCLLLGLLAALCEATTRLVFDSSFLGGMAAQGRAPTLALFAAGAFAGPLFEELLFRALLYATLRRSFNVALSVMLVTALFAAAHLPGSRVPLVEATGGIFFALSLEYTGSILAPILIHIAGNLAIFLLPALFNLK